MEGDENQIALTGQSFELIKIIYYGGSTGDPIPRFYVKYGLSCNLNKSNEKKFQARIKWMHACMNIHFKATIPKSPFTEIYDNI